VEPGTLCLEFRREKSKSEQRAVYEFNLQAAEIRDELTVRENFRNFILAVNKQMDDLEVLTGEAVGELVVSELEEGVEVPDKNVSTGTSPIKRIPKNKDRTEGEPEVKKFELLLDSFIQEQHNQGRVILELREELARTKSHCTIRKKNR